MNERDIGRGRDKYTIDIDLSIRILKYNKEQFKRISSQQRPFDFGFVKKQWFDTDEAFHSAMR